MVLFAGEGVPSPAPPRVISPRYGVWDDAGEGGIGVASPGRPFRRYHDYYLFLWGGGEESDV